MSIFFLIHSPFPPVPQPFKKWMEPGRVAPLVRALSQYANVAGLIPSQGTYKKQPMNV